MGRKYIPIGYRRSTDRNRGICGVVNKVSHWLHRQFFPLRVIIVLHSDQCVIAFRISVGIDVHLQWKRVVCSLSQ